jgi:2,3-dimethylmalate lyase
MAQNRLYANEIHNGEMSGNRSPVAAPFTRKAAGSLKQLLAADEVLVLPGAPDALSARLVERAGFKAAYVSGAGYANVQLGLPDVGMVSHYEIAEHVRRVAGSVSIPIVADGDTGHGGALSVARTVHLFEQAGAAAIQLEDQEMPKRCGHFDGRRQLVTTAQMVAKIRAAKAAATSPDFAVIARTDARATDGFDEAVGRGLAFRDAGADLVFVEAIRSRDELERLPRLVPDVPLVVNIVEGGKTPELSVAEFALMGFKVVLYANFVMRVMAKAAEKALRHLGETGETASMHAEMISWQVRQDLVGLAAWQELESALEGNDEP